LLPKNLGDTIVFDLPHLPEGKYHVQIKIGKHLVHRRLEVEKPKVKGLQKVKMAIASFLSGWLV